MIFFFLFFDVQTMEYFVDDKRHDVNFQVGDWVFVKLRPCRQASVTRASYSKLTKRFFGPFQILRKVSPLVTNFNYHLTPTFI